MNNYIICPKDGNYHPVKACSFHSGGECKNKVVLKVIEERCYGCIRWVDILEAQKNNHLGETIGEQQISKSSPPSV